MIQWEILNEISVSRGWGPIVVFLGVDDTKRNANCIFLMDNMRSYMWIIIVTCAKESKVWDEHNVRRFYVVSTWKKLSYQIPMTWDGSTSWIPKCEWVAMMCTTMGEYVILSDDTNHMPWLRIRTLCSSGRVMVKFNVHRGNNFHIC